MLINCAIANATKYWALVTAPIFADGSDSAALEMFLKSPEHENCKIFLHELLGQSDGLKLLLSNFKPSADDSVDLQHILRIVDFMEAQMKWLADGAKDKESAALLLGAIAIGKDDELGFHKRIGAQHSTLLVTYFNKHFNKESSLVQAIDAMILADAKEHVGDVLSRFSRVGVSPGKTMQPVHGEGVTSESLKTFAALLLDTDAEVEELHKLKDWAVKLHDRTLVSELSFLLILRPCLLGLSAVSSRFLAAGKDEDADADADVTLLQEEFCQHVKIAISDTNAFREFARRADKAVMFKASDMHSPVLCDLMDAEATMQGVLAQADALFKEVGNMWTEKLKSCITSIESCIPDGFEALRATLLKHKPLQDAMVNNEKYKFIGAKCGKLESACKAVKIGNTEGKLIDASILKQVHGPLK